MPPTAPSARAVPPVLFSSFSLPSVCLPSLDLGEFLKLIDAGITTLKLPLNLDYIKNSFAQSLAAQNEVHDHSLTSPWRVCVDRSTSLDGPITASFNRSHCQVMYIQGTTVWHICLPDRRSQAEGSLASPSKASRLVGDVKASS